MRAGTPSRRILMTADPVGGVWRHALDLADGLTTRGCAVHLVTFGRALSPAQRRELDALAGVEATVSELRLEWMEDPWEDLDRAGDLLRSIAARFQPDVIHLNGYALASDDWNAPVLVGAHSCVLSWWRAVKSESAPNRFDRYRREVAAGLAAADRVIAPSGAMLEQLRLRYGADFSGAVVPNGVDPRGFSPVPKKPHVLSAGRLWDGAKNIRLLAGIAATVEWPIRVAGDLTPPNGPDAPGLAGVACLGSLDPEAMRREFLEAALYAAPALYEPFGLAILEAALAGCALVLADIPSLRELWADAAVFVDPTDPPAWRRELNRLAHDPETRRRLAERSRDRARSFTLEAMTEKYLMLYDELAGNARPVERMAA